MPEWHSIVRATMPDRIRSPLPPEKPRILIDTREQRPWVFSGEVETEVCSLPTADYSLAGFTDRVCVERKSLDDLVQSLTWERERFLNACQRMEAYTFRALIAECSLDDILAHRFRSKARPSSIVGSLVALGVDHGLPTIFAGSPEMAAQLCERLLTRIWRKAREASNA